MADGDEWEIPRRKLLYGLSAIGTAAAAGTPSTGLFRDGEGLGAGATAGSLDLEASWADGGNAADFGTVEAAGDGGSDRVRLSVPADGNAASVWFRTRCRQCSEVEERLSVSLRLDANDGETRLFDGTLGEAREEFGAGVRFADTLSPGETWDLVVEWTLDEPLETATGVDFAFDFHAVQARNVDDPAAYAPGWSCPGGCAGRSDTSDVSWVGFCAGPGEVLRPDDIKFSVDGSAVELAGAPSGLATVLLKHGTKLDVFDDPPASGTFVAGDGETYDQQRSGFDGTDRSNPTPCPGACGLKYEVDGGWSEPEGCTHD